MRVLTLSWSTSANLRHPLEHYWQLLDVFSPNDCRNNLEN